MSRFHVAKCKCGGETEVKEARLRKSGIFYRRRVCRDCGAKVTTREVPAWYLDLLESNLKLEKKS